MMNLKDINDLACDSGPDSLEGSWQLLPIHLRVRPDSAGPALIYTVGACAVELHGEPVLVLDAGNLMREETIQDQITRRQDVSRQLADTYLQNLLGDAATAVERGDHQEAEACLTVVLANIGRISRAELGHDPVQSLHRRD